MAKNNIFSNIKNFFITPSNITLKSQRSGIANRMAAGGSIDPEKNLGNTLVPIQMPRIRQDVQNWRASIEEAEMAIYPFRVLMQQMYIDTANDGHVKSAVEARKALTLLRKYIVRNENGETDEKWTTYIQKQWFKDYISYTLDAIFYGYTLISLGDCIDNEFPEITIVRRWNISPDRTEVASITYVPNGIRFLEGEERKWHVWVKTASDVGVSNCGYGLYYILSYSAIIIRNNTSANITYNELFGSPTKVLKTAASNEEERQAAEWALQRLGNAGGVVLKPEDELEFIEAKSGAGYKSYADLELRHKNLISQLILGHQDAISSIPGKLGNNTATKPGEIGSPVQEALSAIQQKDGDFVMHYINNELLPRMREIGINIPIDYYVEALNDDEEEEIQKKQNDLALDVATIAMNALKGGIQIDPKFFEQVTGFKTVDKAVAPTVQPAPNQTSKPANILNYGKKPAGVSQEEWDAYCTDMDYKKETKDFDGDRDGMTKEEYQDYVDDIQEHIDNDIPLDREPGETCDVHINCQCSIEDGEWVLGNEACDDCVDAAEDFNASKNSMDIENIMSIFNNHKIKNKK